MLRDMINGTSYNMVFKDWGKPQNTLPAEIRSRDIPNIKQDGKAI
jgi:hypothetical protein